MELRFLDRETKLVIQGFSYDDELKFEFDGVFKDIFGYTTIIAECAELSRVFFENKKFNDDYYLKVNFSQSHNIYTFKGKIKGIAPNQNENHLYIVQMSNIKESSRRTYPRLDIMVDLNLFDSNGSLILQGKSFNISVEGLCMLSNTPLESDKDSFNIAFIVNIHDTFLLPAKLVRRGNVPQKVHFKYDYDYGFEFDFSENDSEKTRLIDSLLKHRARGLK